MRAALFRPCSFSDAEKAAAFEAVLGAVAVNCELGQSTIVDGMPFSRAGEYEAVRDVAEAHGACAAGAVRGTGRGGPTARSRAGRRGMEAAGDRDEDLVAGVAGRFRPPPEGTLELDGLRPAGELARSVMQRLRTGP